tara:strand:+ start:56 stop:880 length:825 start_codon:yes stop_codon:yes gene_type:complete
MSTKFVIEKYEIIIVSDLRQIAPIFFIFLKFFSSSKIIIEHEQRSAGLTLFGVLATFFLFPLSLLAFWRANLIRSPNVYSTNYLEKFPFIKHKILEIPLVANKANIPSNNSELKKKIIFTSGKRFFSKGGDLILKIINHNPHLNLKIITNCKLNIHAKNIIEISKFQNIKEFLTEASQCNLAIYLSPSQSFYDVAAIGLKVIVDVNSLPRTKKVNLENFIPLKLETDKQGNVINNYENFKIINSCISSHINDKNCGHSYKFTAKQLLEFYIDFV